MRNAERFEKMIGNTYLYRTEQYTVMNIVYVEDDLYDVETDRRTIRMNADLISKEFLPVQSPTRKKNTAALMKYLPDDQSMVNLSAVINENIKKLQTDPKFIEQARAINEQAKTLIDLKKLQLDVIKTARDL